MLKLGFFFLMMRRPPTSTHRYTLFPYTTLFRSGVFVRGTSRRCPLSFASLPVRQPGGRRSEEHTSELQSHRGISYAVFCLQKKNQLTLVPICAVLNILYNRHRHYIAP